MKKLLLAQLFILAAGTIFAWTNFIIELTNWMHNQACTLGCLTNTGNPFFSPCFFGALFFLISFIIQTTIYSKYSKNSKR